MFASYMRAIVCKITDQISKFDFRVLRAESPTLTMYVFFNAVYTIFVQKKNHSLTVCPSPINWISNIIPSQYYGYSSSDSIERYLRTPSPALVVQQSKEDVGTYKYMTDAKMAKPFFIQRF